MKDLDCISLASLSDFFKKENYFVNKLNNFKSISYPCCGIFHEAALRMSLDISFSELRKNLREMVEYFESFKKSIEEECGKKLLCFGFDFKIDNGYAVLGTVLTYKVKFIEPIL